MNQLDRYLELCSRIRVLNLELRAAEAEKRLIEMQVVEDRTKADAMAQVVAERNRRMLGARSWRGISLLPLILLCAAATFAPVPQPTQTRMALKMAVRLQAKTNSNFVVAWKPGDPPQTYITNTTTGTGYYAGTNIAAGFTAPIGLTNIVTGANTFSNQWDTASVTVVVGPTNGAWPVLSIRPIQLVEISWVANSNNAGRVHRLLESPPNSFNGVWSVIYSVTPTNGQVLKVVRTNDAGGHYYKSYWSQP